MDIGYSTLAITDGGSEHMVSVVLMYSQDEAKNTELKVGSARRFTAADMRIVLPGREGLLGRSIDQGTAQLGKGLAKDTELSRIVALRKCRVSYCIPLRTGLGYLWRVAVCPPGRGVFHRRAVRDPGYHWRPGSHRHSRTHACTGTWSRKKSASCEIQEEARKKLARDLHDGPTQSVAAHRDARQLCPPPDGARSAKLPQMSCTKSRSWPGARPRKSATCSSPCAHWCSNRRDWSPRWNPWRKKCTILTTRR